MVQDVVMSRMKKNAQTTAGAPMSAVGTFHDSMFWPYLTTWKALMAVIAADERKPSTVKVIVCMEQQGSC